MDLRIKNGIVRLMKRLALIDFSVNMPEWMHLLTFFKKTYLKVK